jgi:threonylcarbamoyladenosine tRNA methylthiotransferase MtaB
MAEETRDPVIEAATPGQPQLVTFGCRLNAFESEVIRNHAQAAGLADAIIINTCAVTSEAERQARQAIRKARRLNPEARIIVTGCAAQIAPEKFAAMDEVDAVLGNEEKLKAESFTALSLSRAPHVAVADIMTVTETAPHLISGFAAAPAPLSRSSRAAIIAAPSASSRSAAATAARCRPAPSSTQIRQLVANGYNEVVLTGVDITSYGGGSAGQDGPGCK